MKLTQEQRAKVRAAEATQNLEQAQLEIVLLKSLIEEKDAEIKQLKATDNKPEADWSKSKEKAETKKAATKVEKQI